MIFLVATAIVIIMVSFKSWILPFMTADPEVQIRVSSNYILMILFVFTDLNLVVHQGVIDGVG